MRRLWLVLALWFTFSVQAEVLHYSLNTQRSSLLLHWQMIGKSNYHGRIGGLSGTLTINPQRDSDNHIQVTIPIGNLDAHHKLLTWALKSRQFFDQNRYPNAYFTSSRIVDQGGGRYRVFGNLQIRDQRHPVVLYALLSPDSRLRSTSPYLRFSGTIMVSRAGFGMGQYPHLVADPIAVEIRLLVGSP